MSVKSAAASFLFSIEVHEWVHGVSPRFQRRTLADTHTELSLQHPQAGGRQLIHLKACEQHLLLSWAKCSVTHFSFCSNEASFHLCSADNSWITFCSYFHEWNHPSFSTWGMVIESPLSFLLWKFFPNLWIISGSLLEAGAVWMLSQMGCAGAGLPPPSRGHLSFLRAAEAALHHDLSSPTSFPCPFHSSRVAHFQHILSHWKYIEICFSPQ